MADYCLPSYAKVFSRDIGIRKLDSKIVGDVTIEQAIRCAGVYQTDDIRMICSKAKPNLKQWQSDVIATSA